MDVRLSNATLACWKHLTYPTFDRLSSGNLLQLAALSRLKQLNLLAGYDVAVGPSRIPGLLLPASVETLLLSSPVEAGILSLVPTGLQELQVLYAVRCPVYEPDAFVPSLRRLRQLTQLKLHPRRGIDWPAAGPAFYALTASTNLVHLDIVDADFPEGVWRHVFSPRHKLPHRAVFFFHDALQLPARCYACAYVGYSRPQQPCELLPQLVSGWHSCPAAWVPAHAPACVAAAQAHSPNMLVCILEV